MSRKLSSFTSAVGTWGKGWGRRTFERRKVHIHTIAGRQRIRMHRERVTSSRPRSVFVPLDEAEFHGVLGESSARLLERHFSRNCSRTKTNFAKAPLASIRAGKAARCALTWGNSRWGWRQCSLIARETKWGSAIAEQGTDSITAGSDVSFGRKQLFR